MERLPARERHRQLGQAAKLCSPSRNGQLLLSCWITAELRMACDGGWAAKGQRPLGRTVKGSQEMVAAYLAAHTEP